MQKNLTFVVFLLSLGSLLAQNEPLQPFESLGKKVKVLTMSNGKYQETFPNDSIMRIGSVMYNRNTGEVLSTVENDTMYGEYNLKPEVASRWLSPDPLGNKFPNWSPYNYTLNNPVRLVDPDGQAPGDPMIGFGIGLRISGGSYSASIAVGASYRSGNFMGGLNISANFYNSGLGTSHGSTGNFSSQIDLVGSPSLTIGGGQGASLPLNTFNNNTSTGVNNDFAGSGTIGSNFVFNSEGRNQRVGFLGGKSGDVGLGVYNDLFKFAGGDGDDRWWTGGGNVTAKVGEIGTLTFGTDVFTGDRLGKNPATNKWLEAPGNPSGGRFGTYQQSEGNQQLNNGQSLLILRGFNGFNLGGATGGQNHMYSQNGIHNYLSKNKLFQSTANGL
jgi:RHS repeat-associated protein